MKKSWIIVMALLLFSGCTRQESQVQKLDSIQAFEMSSQQSEIVIVDVRTEAEYNQGHIQNSINVPLDQITTTMEDIIESKKTPIFVVCRSGNRSAQAQTMLQSMGYTDVIDIGSVFEWPETLIISSP